MEIDPRMVLDSIDNGIVAINAEGMIKYFNQTAEKIFSIPAHDAIDRFIIDVLPGTGEKLLESLQTGKAFHGEKLKGEGGTLTANITPLTRDGKVSGAVSIFQDISEIEEVSRELALLKNMKNWLDAVIDSSYDGLWICNREGKVIKINKASERICDVKAENVVGRNMRELVAEGLYDRSVTFEVVNRKTAVTLIQRTRENKRLLITGNPIFDEQGEVVFVVTNGRDMTELDILRTQLEETQALAKGYISKLSELEMKEVDLSNIIFRSGEMERIVEVALRVAKVDSTVLLLGQSGVGKGLIAKLIHKHSDRSQGPFIRVDFAGIPDSLVESELFGYEKGAFTGARIEGKVGFFELANGGTLFLDEIGEIPLSSQSKLLRFLEDREIIRVGGTSPKAVDVKIVAATNRNIEEMVASKRFREDLYYRLNVVPIHIPPLRERREDVTALALYLMEKFSITYKKKRALSPQALHALYRYDFPGNVRELANLIERLVVTAANDKIEMKDLPKEITGYSSKNFHIEDKPLKEVMEHYESMIIETAMKKYGSQQEAANALKVDQATISRKMKKHNIWVDNVIMHK